MHRIKKTKQHHLSVVVHTKVFSYHKRKKFLVHDNELIHDRAHRASTVSTAYKSLVHCTSIPNIPSPKKPFKVKEHVTSTQAA